MQIQTGERRHQPSDGTAHDAIIFADGLHYISTSARRSTLAAKRREHSDSGAAAGAGATLTNMSVLASPPSAGCTIRNIQKAN